MARGADNDDLRALRHRRQLGADHRAQVRAEHAEEAVERAVVLKQRRRQPLPFEDPPPECRPGAFGQGVDPGGVEPAPSERLSGGPVRAGDEKVAGRADPGEGRTRAGIDQDERRDRLARRDEMPGREGAHRPAEEMMSPAGAGPDAFR